MNKHFLLVLISIALLISACNKSTEIGGILINQNEYHDALQTDTFSINVNHYIDDSLRTTILYNDSLAIENREQYLLGNISDPVFGNTAASIYLQPRLKNNNTDLGDNLSLDSIVLVLDYYDKTPYGNTKMPVNISVYEVNETMSARTTLYSTQSYEYEPEPLGEKLNYYFAPTDSVIVNKILVSQEINNTDTTYTTKVEPKNSRPQIRIKLNNKFGYKLLAQSGKNAFKDNTNFTQFFKGLFINTQSTDNTIGFLNLNSATTRLIVYYKQNNLNITPLDFPITENSITLNHYQHSYSTTINNALQQPYPNFNNTIYLQAMSGLGLNIEFPTLAQLNKVAVYKAELEFYSLVSPNETIYPSPASVSFFVVSGNESEKLAVTNVFTKDTVDVNGTAAIQYKLILDTYSQNLINKKYESYQARMFISAAARSAERAIIAGPKHPTLPMKLNLIYTNITD